MISHPIDPILLSAYRDGALDDSDREFVEGHLASCSACEQRLAEYAWLGDALRTSTGVAVPASVDTRVSALLRARRETGSRFLLPRLGFPRQAWGAVALSALLLVALWFGLPTDDGAFGPTVASAFLVEEQGTPTIRVEFQGGIDRDSVARTVQIEPSIPVSVEWQGDTLVVRPVAPLHPTRQYTLKLSTAGSQQEATPVSLQFAGAAPETPMPLATQAAPVPAPGEIVAVAATDTATPTVAATETPASPTATATVEATRTAIPTPTPSEPNPQGQFELFFRGHPAIALRLGEPVAAEGVVSVATQHYQRGLIVSRSDTLETLLLRDGFEAQSYPDVPPEDQGSDANIADRGGVLTALLARDPDVAAMLGVATSPVLSTVGVAREYENGSALWTPDGAVLVLYGKGGWERSLDGGTGSVPILPPPGETPAIPLTTTPAPVEPTATPVVTTTATATAPATEIPTATGTETATTTPALTPEPEATEATPEATDVPARESATQQETATATTTPTPVRTVTGGSS